MALVVAIDGPAGAGKSSVARGVAQRCRLAFVDTGAIYRALALFASHRGVSVDDEGSLAELAHALPLTFENRDGRNTPILDGEDVSEAIRAPHVSSAASKVSRHPAVREALLDVQRALGHQGRGSVLEGRDIGTVVFPDAAVKIFLTASAEERARRRALELHERGQGLPYAVILDEIKTRDRRDMEREVAPLVQASDAILVDSTRLTEVEVIAQIANLVSSFDADVVTAEHPVEEGIR